MLNALRGKGSRLGMWGGLGERVAAVYRVVSEDFGRVI